MQDLINTYIIEFKERWFGNRVNIYHHCDADRNKLIHQPAVMVARSFAYNKLFGKLMYCSMTPTEYQKIWDKAEREDNTTLLRQFM